MQENIEEDVVKIKCPICGSLNLEIFPSKFVGLGKTVRCHACGSEFSEKDIPDII